MSYNPPDFGVFPPDVILSDGSVAMTADLDLGTNKIVNVVDPTTDQQAATKKYVDDNVGAVDVQAAGYWSPLTNGNPSSPALIFDDDGDTIAVWTGA